MNALARLALGPEWTTLGLRVLLQVTGIVLVAGLLARALLGRHGAARHGLWLGTLVWVLASPVIAVVVNHAGLTFWSVDLPLPRAASSDPPHPAAAQHDALPEGRARNTLASAEAHPERVVAADRAAEAEWAAPARLVVPQGAPLWPAVLGGVTVVWAAGVLVGLARMAAGWGRIAAMTRGSRPLDTERHRDTLAQVKAALGARVLPPVVTSGTAVGPVAIGVFRPHVVLPEGLADALTPGALRDVLIHECAHVFRRDPWVGLFQRLAAALYWPHPLVHYLNAQLARAREEVCDNFVIQRGDACGYARTLLTLTELCQTPGACRAGLGLLGLRWTLADRVAGLLDPGRVSMTRISLRTKMAVAVALFVTGLSVASVRIGSRLRADEPAPAVKNQAAANPEAPASFVWNLQGVAVDEHDRPVAGAVVGLPESTAEPGVRVGTTATDGTFTLVLDQQHLGVIGIVVEADGGARVGLARFELGEATWRSPPKQPVRIVVKPARALTVHVKDAAGVPVAGAAVTAVEHRYQTGSSTGPDGTASLRVAADAQVEWVMGQKSGAGFDFYENYRSYPTTSFPPLPAELSLTLDGARTFRIKAVDSKDRPLPGIRFAPSGLGKPGKVDQARTAWSPVSWVTTDEQGVAVLDWLPKNDWLLTFEIRSKEYSALNGLNPQRPGGPLELTVRLLRATRLSGTARLPDGHPARGVRVGASGSGTSTNPTVGVAWTGADGTYALDVPPEMAYSVGVTDEAWAAPARPGVIVHENQPRDGLDFALTKGTLLHGQITAGPDHAPMAGARVTLIEEGPVLPKEYRERSANAEFSRGTTADAQGMYHFRVVPGRYMLRLRGFEPVTSPVEVTDAADVVRDLSLQRSARATIVTGVVVEMTPAGERPVPGAIIAGLRVGGYGGTYSRADEEGKFRALRRSDTVLYARGDGPDSVKLAGFTPVADSASEVKLVVAPAAKVTGRVVESSGKPQANRRVMVQLDFGADPSKSAHYQMGVYTNEQGRFVFPYFPVGTQGEFAVPHETDGRPNGARTAVRFQVPTLETVEVTDLIVPAFKGGEPAPPGAGADAGRQP